MSHAKFSICHANPRHGKALRDNLFISLANNTRCLANVNTVPQLLDVAQLLHVHVGVKQKGASTGVYMYPAVACHAQDCIQALVHI